MSQGVTLIRRKWSNFFLE